MRKPMMAGNWKLNKTVSESTDLASKLKKSIGDLEDREVVLCPTFVSIDSVSEAVAGSNISVGGQNIYFEESGAFTGEISAPILKSTGASHVIIGHSERRQYFGETDETVNKKIKSALKHSLTPIVCVGETLEEREGGKAFDVIKTQIDGGLSGLTDEEVAKIVIAYEPVWAIGTGKTASPEQAQEVHAFIRGLLPKSCAASVRILYGGSVKPDNVKTLMAKEDIDGALVGGASLKAEDFEKIVMY